MTYQPAPLDIGDVKLPPSLHPLLEQLAKNTHDIWAAQRLEDGWTYGPRRDDELKTHPGLRPYEQLSDSEKRYDRRVSQGTIKAVIALGYKIERA